MTWSPWKLGQGNAQGKRPVPVLRSEGEGKPSSLSPLRQMLADAQRAILSAQNETLTTAIAQLERRQDSKIEAIEKKLGEQNQQQSRFDDTLGEVQTRLLRLEEGGSTAAPSHSGSVPVSQRRLTLVIGGFPRDSKRALIHDKVDNVLSSLEFTTGPRRTCALLPFKQRQGESFNDAKQRLHFVLGAIVKAKFLLQG